MSDNGKIKISHTQLNMMLAAVEHGYKAHAKGASLEEALAALFRLYEVQMPSAT